MTLLEVMVVISIVGILSTMGFGALNGLSRSQEVSSSIQTLASYAGNARLQAIRRSYPVVLLAYVPANTQACPRVPIRGWAGAENCVRFYLILDRGPVYLSSNLTATGALPDYDPDGAGPTAGNDLVLDATIWTRNVVPQTAGTAALPAPFNAIPTNSACSFCTLTSNLGNVPMGAIVFNPDGTTRMTGSSTAGGSVVVNTSNGTGGARTFALTSPLGLGRIF